MGMRTCSGQKLPGQATTGSCMTSWLGDLCWHFLLAQQTMQHYVVGDGSSVTHGFSNCLQQHGFPCSTEGRDGSEEFGGGGAPGGGPLCCLLSPPKCLSRPTAGTVRLSQCFCFVGPTTKFLLSLLPFALWSQMMTLMYKGFPSSCSN